MVVNTVIRVKRVSKGVIGVEVVLPNAPPLVLIRGSRGFVMCGYLDMSVAEKLGLVCARVTGISSVEEMLDAVISEASSAAIKQGIKPGMRVRDVVKAIE